MRKTEKNRACILRKGYFFSFSNKSRFVLLRDFYRLIVVYIFELVLGEVPDTTTQSSPE